jgi:Pectate lyase superfamily protein
VSRALPIPGKDPFAGAVINVRGAGARGDGTTDDTAKLQAAIADSSDGDAIYFPPGIYLVGAPLVPKPRQVYFSLTGKATVKAKEGTPFTLFQVEAGPVEFHHLTLDLSKPPDVEPPDCKTPDDVPAGIVAEALAGGVVELVVTPAGSTIAAGTESACAAVGTRTAVTAWSSATPLSRTAARAGSRSAG